MEENDSSGPTASAAGGRAAPDAATQISKPAELNTHEQVRLRPAGSTQRHHRHVANKCLLLYAIEMFACNY